MDNIMKTGAEAIKAAGEFSGCDNSVLSGIFALPPAQFSLLATVLGFLFVDGLDLGQQNSLGNFIVGIGQSILTAAAQGQLLKDNTDPTEQMQKQIQLLRKQVETLERKVNQK